MAPSATQEDMSIEEHPDQDTISMLREVIANHHKRHAVLGPSDEKEYFFALLHEAYETEIGIVITMECSQCGSSDTMVLSKGEKPPQPDAFICHCCLSPEDEDE